VRYHKFAPRWKSPDIFLILSRKQTFGVDFSKAFGTFSCNTLIGELRKCGLDGWTVRWLENWLNGRTERVVISGT